MHIATSLTTQVVFIAVMDDLATSGTLAMGFEELGVRYTGANWMAMQLCNDAVGCVCVWSVCIWSVCMWSVYVGATRVSLA